MSHPLQRCESALCSVPSQLKALEASFAQEAEPPGEEVDRLRAETKMTRREIHGGFAEKRKKVAAERKREEAERAATPTTTTTSSSSTTRRTTAGGRCTRGTPTPTTWRAA